MKAKFFLSFLICFIFFVDAFAQFKSKNYNTNHSKFYLGLGTGINSSCGILGIKSNIELGPKAMLDIGLGLGTWGYKQTLNILYLTKPENGWCPGIGISRGTGIDTITILINSRNVKSGNVSNNSVRCRLKNMYAMNFMVQKQWYTKSKNRLALDLGLAIQLRDMIKDPVKSLNSDYELTEFGKKSTLLLAPGGLIVGFSYNFKL